MKIVILSIDSQSEYNIYNYILRMGDNRLGLKPRKGNILNACFNGGLVFKNFLKT